MKNWGCVVVLNPFVHAVTKLTRSNHSFRGLRSLHFHYPCSTIPAGKEDRGVWRSSPITFLYFWCPMTAFLAFSGASRMQNYYILDTYSWFPVTWSEILLWLVRFSNRRGSNLAQKWQNAGNAIWKFSGKHGHGSNEYDRYCPWFT
jgi:hypothetical protein